MAESDSTQQPPIDCYKLHPTDGKTCCSSRIPPIWPHFIPPPPLSRNGTLMNGFQLEFSRVEVGFTMQFIDQSLTLCSSGGLSTFRHWDHCD